MKSLVFALMLCSVVGTAQITYEHSYPAISGYEHMRLFHLSNAGYKYVESNNDSLILYNLNHSVYLTIQIPPLPPMSSSAQSVWISDELFNTNPSDIEYMLIYTTPPGIAHVTVFDQTGNLLFSRDSFYLNTPAAGYQGIQHTSSGVKMLMYNQYTNDVVIYGLPGVLPCTMCDNGVISGIQESPSGPDGNQQQLPNPYPNPTNSTTTIPYQLPTGISTGQLIVYDLLGQEVKRYSVTSSFTSLEIETGELPSGTYSYSLQTSAGIIAGNKFVVVE